MAKSRPVLVLHIFTMEGYFPFPMSQLPTQKCWPAGQEDAKLINEAFPREYRKRMKVTMCRYAPEDWEPSNWDLYGWEVIDHEILEEAE